MSYKRHKVCIKCEELKSIDQFPYGYGSYRKSGKCKQCTGEPIKQWSFGGSIRAITTDSRICKSSTYFNKKLPSLSRLKEQATMINNRDYIEMQSDK